MSHIPVLLKEVLSYIESSNLQEFIDGTVGDGGYIKEILKVNKTVKVLGIDLDQSSLDKLSMQLAQESLGQKYILVQGNFIDIKSISIAHDFRSVSAVILDLGFSSSQIDDENRGLSFQKSGPLDMRFDLKQTKTAAAIVNKYSLGRLTEIFKNYGEEKFAGKIAFEIVRQRQQNEIKNTEDLFEIIKASLPKPVAYKASDNARRIFQALRIEVNDELNSLRKVLPDILDILAPKGRMLIISFHSLEDKIVKEFFNQEAKGCICPPDFPQCVCDKNSRLKILTKKPIIASEKEIEINSRSKPAKLRVAEKIGI